MAIRFNILHERMKAKVLFQPVKIKDCHVNFKTLRRAPGQEDRITETQIDSKDQTKFAPFSVVIDNR